jgi:hypothetical protein
LNFFILFSGNHPVRPQTDRASYTPAKNRGLTFIFLIVVPVMEKAIPKKSVSVFFSRFKHFAPSPIHDKGFRQ